MELLLLDLSRINISANKSNFGVWFLHKLDGNERFIGLKLILLLLVMKVKQVSLI